MYNYTDSELHSYLLLATSKQFLGKTGIVNRVGLDEITVLLTSFLSAAKFRLVPDAVKKVFTVYSPVCPSYDTFTSFQVEGPDILPDDVVRVIDDMAEVHRLQKDGRGWEDDMALVRKSYITLLC